MFGKFGNIYWMIGGIIAVIAGIFLLVTGDYLWGIIGLAVGGWLAYSNYKKLKASKPINK